MNISKSFKTLLDINLSLKFCTVQCMHASINVMDKSMDNSNILMLGMEPRKWSSFFRIITVSLLIQSSVDILLDSRNPATAKTKCCMCYYHPKIIETFWAHTVYTLTTYKCQHWDSILAALSVLNTYIIHDDQLCLNGLDTYVLCTVHEQDSQWWQSTREWLSQPLLLQHVTVAMVRSMGHDFSKHWVYTFIQYSYVYLPTRYGPD